MAEKKDFYETLGLKKGASSDEIRSAFRKLAMEHHPDKNPGDASAEEKFKEINEAYSILSDPEKREKYDKFGFAGIDPNAGFGGYGYSDFSTQDAYDIFNQFFGGSFGGFGGFSGFSGFSGFGGFSDTPRRNGPRRGSDIQKRMNITFDEAVFGARKKIRLTKDVLCETCNGSGCEPGSGKTTCETCGGRGQVVSIQKTLLGQVQTARTCHDCGGSGQKIEKPCKDCSGSGKVRKTIELNVDIPAGVDNDSIITLRGQGQIGSGGGQPGDLYIVLSVAPHEVFKRSGDDIWIEVPVTFSQAALGDNVTVPGLSEKLSCKIPAGTQPGTVLRMKGKGVRNLHSGRPGDMYVEVDVEIPTRLNSSQKELVRKLGENEGFEGYKKRRKFSDTLKSMFK